MEFFDRVAPQVNVEEVKAMMQGMAEAIDHLDTHEVDTQGMKDMWNMAATALFQVSLMEENEQMMGTGMSQSEAGYDPCVHAIASFAVAAALSMCDSQIEDHMTPCDHSELQ